MRSCQEVRFWAESGLNFGMLSLSAYSHKQTSQITRDCVGNSSPGKLPHKS